MDVNYIKHLRKIYENYSNINGKETEVMWKIIGNHAYQKEQGKIDYESFGKYIADLIDKVNMN